MTINERVARALGEKELALLLQQQQIEELQAKVAEFEGMLTPISPEPSK